MSKRSHGSLKIRHIISGSRHVSPANSSVAINSKGTARLPPRATLCWSIPDALILSKAEDIPQRERINGVPR